MLLIRKDAIDVNDKKAFLNENREQLTLFGVIVAALLVIIVGMLVCEVPVIWACLLILLEAVLAVCMQNVPIWLHGLVVIAQVVVGAVFGTVVYLVLCAIFYMVGILALDVWSK